MYIHRIIIRNFRNFENLDITLFDDDLQRPLDSVLLIGPNGSGKTTLLRVISALWENFGGWLHSDSLRNPFLIKSELVAMEIRHFDLPPTRQQPLDLFDASDKPSSIWIYITSDAK
nr:AAA family ATPase [Anaerolineae bacterium]